MVAFTNYQACELNQLLKQMSLESSTRYESKIRTWGATTDPAEHNPAAFRYLVHALDPCSKSYALRYIESAASKGISFNNRTQGDQSISMHDQPERLAERMSLTMSLIDQDHTATYDNVGLIVEAPEINIILTSVWDAGSFAFSYDLDALIEWGQFYRRMSGDELLWEGRDTSVHNEVVAIGRSDDQYLRLGGFFYKTALDGHPCDATQTDKIRLQAARLDLPMVAIRDINP